VTKRETLVEMLRRWDDATNTLIKSGDGSNGWPQLMPPTWNQSYRQLDHALKQLRAQQPEPYRHLHARYIDPWRMRTTVKVKNGRPLLPSRTELAAGAVITGERTATIVVTCWAEWVDMLLVATALDTLEQLYPGEPYMPKEFIAA
jgi:hypothetical protein